MSDEGAPSEAGAAPSLRAVLLDAGGTLIHMPLSPEELLASLCGRMGHPITLDQARAGFLASEQFYSDHYLSHPGGRNDFWLRYHAQALLALGIPDPAGERAAFLSHSFGQEGVWQAYPEARDACAALLGMRLRLGVVSNGPTTVPDLLAHAGLLDFFEVVVTSQGEGMEKPDPRIFRAALERMGLSPAEVVYAGDLPEVDVLGARAAGMRGILVDRHGTGAPFECPVVRDLTEMVHTIGAIEGDRASGAGLAPQE